MDHGKARMLHLPTSPQAAHPRTGGSRTKLLSQALLPLLLLGRLGLGGRLRSWHSGRFSQGRRQLDHGERFRERGCGGGAAVAGRATMAVGGCAIGCGAVLAGQLQEAAIGGAYSKQAAAQGSWRGSSVASSGGGSGGGPNGRPRKPRTQCGALPTARGHQGKHQARQGGVTEPRHVWAGLLPTGWEPNGAH